MNDTPTERAAINQLSVDELDDMLTAIRARRLERVQKLEAIARVKADDAQLVDYMRFEKAYAVAKRHMDKCIEMEKKAEELIHKLRLRVFELQQ
jgi:hypothetical protein